MAQQQPIEVIDIRPGKNLWAAPTWASCFGIELEGPMPTDDERQRREHVVAQRRSGWSPDAPGWRQLQAITNAIVRRQVVIKIWDAIIVALDESEGPYPIAAVCTGVDTRLDETGALQAYLRLEQLQVIRIPDGFDAMRKHVVQTEDGSQWINLGDLYEIQILAAHVGS